MPLAVAFNVRADESDQQKRTVAYLLCAFAQVRPHGRKFLRHNRCYTSLAVSYRRFYRTEFGRSGREAGEAVNWKRVE
jgi:hypothetical protein